MRKYKEVINPGKAKKTEDVISMIVAWEAKVIELEKEEGVNLGNMVKLAALTEITTEEVQDIIYQTLKDDTKYHEVKEQIVRWISNREAAKDKGCPIGNVGQGQENGQDEDYDHEENLICYGCGGEGHPARLCPMKGKGKGKDFGGGKAAFGKGEPWGKGGGYNGFGGQNQNWQQGPK